MNAHAAAAGKKANLRLCGTLPAASFDANSAIGSGPLCDWNPCRLPWILCPSFPSDIKSCNGDAAGHAAERDPDGVQPNRGDAGARHLRTWRLVHTVYPSGRPVCRLSVLVARTFGDKRKHYGSQARQNRRRACKTLQTSEGLENCCILCEHVLRELEHRKSPKPYIVWWF